MRLHSIKIIILPVAIFFFGLLALIMPSTAHATVGALKGSVYMMYDGTRFPLKNVDIYVKHCRGTGDYSTCSSWSSESNFYSDDPTVASSYTQYRDWAGTYNYVIETDFPYAHRAYNSGHDGEYRFENGNRVATYRGNIYDGDGGTSSCGDNTCGLDCGINAWRASLTTNGFPYDIANFPAITIGSTLSHINFSRGHWLPHLNTGEEAGGTYTNYGITGDAIWMRSSNGEGHVGWDFEWVPDYPIYGTVVDSTTNAPLKDVSVTIYDDTLHQAGTIPYQTDIITDSSGHFSLPSFVSGGHGYAVRAPTKTGYGNPITTNPDSSRRNYCATVSNTYTLLYTDYGPTVDQPAYECQTAGNSDCSHAGSAGCNFKMDSVPPPATPVPVVATTPNCYNLSSSAGTTLKVGQTTTLSAGYNISGGDLWGGIAIGQTAPTLDTFLPSGDYSYPINISGLSGSLSSDWTPTAAGTYTVMCNAMNFGVTECRGNSSYVDTAAGQTTCVGNTSSGGVTTLTITVKQPPSNLTLQVGQGDTSSLITKPWQPYTGKTSAGSGSNYHNNLAIRAQATAGSGSTITQYYVAFIDKTTYGGSPIVCSTTDDLSHCLTRFTNVVRSTDLLLKFGKDNPGDSSSSLNYYVYDQGSWNKISPPGSSGYIEDEHRILDSGALRYTIKGSYPLSSYSFTNYKWLVTFNNDAVGSKAFYTAVIAVNNFGDYSMVGDLSPTNFP